LIKPFRKCFDFGHKLTSVGVLVLVCWLAIYKLFRGVGGWCRRLVCWCWCVGAFRTPTHQL